MRGFEFRGAPDGSRMEVGWKSDGSRMGGGWKADGSQMEVRWKSDGSRTEVRRKSDGSRTRPGTQNRHSARFDRQISCRLRCWKVRGPTLPTAKAARNLTVGSRRMAILSSGARARASSRPSRPESAKVGQSRPRSARVGQGRPGRRGSPLQRLQKAWFAVPLHAAAGLDGCAGPSLTGSYRTAPHERAGGRDGSP